MFHLFCGVTLWNPKAASFNFCYGFFSNVFVNVSLFHGVTLEKVVKSNFVWFQFEGEIQFCMYLIF